MLTVKKLERATLSGGTPAQDSNRALEGGR
jgi:hypothetical protein